MLCRMCHEPRLVKFLDLGFTPPADAFLTPQQLHEPETHYPLEVASCDNCGQVQLLHVVDPEILYQRSYPYESSTTKAGREHWMEFARTTCQDFNLYGEQKLVVDIGSNVGALLSCFRDQGCRVLGIDPASNIAAIAEKNGIKTLNRFFSADVGTRVLKDAGVVHLVTATNVFAHVDDLNDFVTGVKMMLHPVDGVFVFEAPYLANLVKGLQYDTIYHEHLSYLSLTPLIPFFKRFGLEVFDMHERDIHGGSFRVFVGFEGQHPVSPVIETVRKQELVQGLHKLSNLTRFAKDVEDHRSALNAQLWNLKRGGATIAAVSTPAKGMTLLNYCRIGTDLIDFATEKSKLKIGRYTPGTHIPVMPDSALLENMPDYALLLAWNFAPEIMHNLQDYQHAGGRFIIPVPSPRVV